MIEPLGRSHGNPLQLSDMLIGNTLIILKEDVLFQKFRGSIPHFDSGQSGIEVSPAVFTSEFMAAYFQRHRIHGYAIALDFTPERILGAKLLTPAMGASIFSRPSDFQHTGRNRQHFRYCHVRQTEYDSFHRVLLLWSECLPCRHIIFWYAFLFSLCPLL